MRASMIRVSWSRSTLPSVLPSSPCSSTILPSGTFSSRQEPTPILTVSAQVAVKLVRFLMSFVMDSPAKGITKASRTTFSLMMAISVRSLPISTSATPLSISCAVSTARAEAIGEKIALRGVREQPFKTALRFSSSDFLPVNTLK